MSSTQYGLPEVQAAQRPDEQRCVVYSFGSRGDDLFERRVLQLAPGCEVHIFDRSAPVRPAPRGGYGPYARTARYHCRYLTADNASSLSTYMRQLGHDYLDVLKVDIEGTEWDVFPGIDWPRARIGQIQVEIHPARPRSTVGHVDALFATLEAAGYRVISIEPVGFPPSDAGSQPVEAVFLHRAWTPWGFARSGHAAIGKLAPPHSPYF